MLKKFRSYLEEEGISQNTIQSYELNTKSYIEFIEKRTETKFKKLHRLNVQDYLKELKKRVDKKQFALGSYNTAINGLIKFNKFLIETGVQNEQAISYKDKMKVQASIEDPNRLTEKTVEKFRQEILNEGNYRNYAIVTILAYCGLRISECLDIRISDISFQSKTLYVRGKGNKTRKAYFGDKVQDAIIQYLPKRKQEALRSTGEEVGENDYLFISSQGNRIEKSVINTYFKTRNAGFTPHDLRHFFCSYAIKNNIYTLEQLATVAGHSNYQTTKQYIHHSEMDLIKAANKF